MGVSKWERETRALTEKMMKERQELVRQKKLKAGLPTDRLEDKETPHQKVCRKRSTLATSQHSRTRAKRLRENEELISKVIENQGEEVARLLSGPARLTAKERRLAPNEGTVGRFVDPFSGKTEGPNRRRREERVTRLTGRLQTDELYEVKRRVRKEIERDIRDKKHPFAFDILTRFEIKHQLSQGIAHHRVAKQYGTSVSVIREIEKMDDMIPKKREEEVIRQFYSMSGVLAQILESVNEEEITQASLGLKLKGVSLLSDKVMAIRKGLDGEAPKKVQVESHHESLLKFGGREGVIEAIKQTMSRLRPFMEAEIIEEEEVKVLPGRQPGELEQLEMFEGQKAGG